MNKGGMIQEMRHDESRLVENADRLSLIRAAGTSMFVALLAFAAPAAAEILVTVGDVTATTARLWLSAPDTTTINVEIVPELPNGVPPILRPSADGRAVATLSGLRPGQRYRYRLHGADETIAGEFVTAPAVDDAAPVTLVWSGDLGRRGHCRRPEGWRVLDAIAARRPDLFLLVGDTIYADRRCEAEAVPGADFVAKTLEEFQARHHYNRADPALQRLLRVTSVSAIWDDHDVRSNFTGSTEPLMPTGLRAFLDYWPVAAPPHGPDRLYRALRWGQLLEIFILDTRRYRSPNCAGDGPGKTMLGTAQRDWLIDAVARSTAQWKVIVSSVPLSIAKGWPCGDSWARRSLLWHATGFAAERDRILHVLAERGVDNLVVLAADVHYASLMTHRPLPGFEVHEFTAGPLAASLKQPKDPEPDLNTTVHFAYGGSPTFGELRVDVDGLDVRLFDGEGRLLTEMGIPASGGLP